MAKIRAAACPLTASTALEAHEIAARHRLDLAVVDLLPADGDGLWLAFELLRLWPLVQVVLMTGTELSADEAALCDRQDFPVLRKPFLAGTSSELFRRASFTLPQSAGHQFDG